MTAERVAAAKIFYRAQSLKDCHPEPVKTARDLATGLTPRGAKTLVRLRGEILRRASPAQDDAFELVGINDSADCVVRFWRS